MARAVLTDLLPRFPTGTVLTAYSRERAREGKAPVGASAGTATVVSDGSATFTGLVAEKAYAAYALVSSQHRYAFFHADEEDAYLIDDDGVFSDGSDGVVLRSRSSVNVKDYGASGDGTTDDTAAIAAAIERVEELVADDFPVVLHFPDGAYPTTTGVRLANLQNVTVEGPGRVVSSAGTTHILSLESVRGFAIRGVAVEHSATGARETNADGINILNCSDGLIDGVTIGYARSIGVRVQASQRVTVSGCGVGEVLADGIGIYSGMRETGATGSIISGSHTLTVGDATNVPLTDDDIGSYVAVPGAGVAAAVLVSTITAVTSPTVCTLDDAASTTVSGATVRVGNASEHVTVIGNRVKGSGDDSYSCVSYNNFAGFDWDAQNTDVVFAGNISEDSGARGVVIAGGRRFTICDNVITGPQASGVQVYYDAIGDTTGCQDGTVVGNVVDDSALGGTDSASIHVESASTTYPVDNVLVANNVTRGGRFSYVYVGNSTAGTSNVSVRGNRCVGVPEEGSAIQVANTVNADVCHNTISGAFDAAISVEATGQVRVQDNDFDTINIGANGFAGIAVDAPSPIISGNQSAQSGLAVAIDASSSTTPLVYGNRFTSGAIVATASPLATPGGWKIGDATATYNSGGQYVALDKALGIGGAVFIYPSGAYESFSNGAGLYLHSPNGTRYLVSVADGGTISVAAA